MEKEIQIKFRIFYLNDYKISKRKKAILNKEIDGNF